MRSLVNVMEKLPRVLLFCTPLSQPNPLYPTLGRWAAAVEDTPAEDLDWSQDPWDALSYVADVGFLPPEIDADWWKVKEIARVVEEGNIWTAEWKDGEWIQPFEPSEGLPYVSTN